MESADVLQSIAEVSVALAGFGGLAAGLGYRGRGDWSEDDQVRLFMLAMISLAVVFGCYFPHVATSLGATNPWRIASTVFLLVPLSILSHQAWLNRHGVPAGTSRAVAGLLATIMLASVVVLSLVVLGFASSNAPGLYLLAALLVLLDASVLFVRLLVTSFRGGAPAAQQGVEPDVE